MIGEFHRPMEVGRSRGRNGDQERAGQVVGGTAMVPEQHSLSGDDGTDLAYQATPIWTEQQVDLTVEPAPVGVTGCLDGAGVVDDLQVDLIGRHPQLEAAGRLSSLEGERASEADGGCCGQHAAIGIA